MTVRVVIVDDQALVRAGFRMVFDSQPDMTVVGEAVDGADALRLLSFTAADVVVMDLRMPTMSGLEATRQICATRSGDRPRVLVLTMFDTEADALSALRAGASGFLPKNVAPEELLAAIRTVAEGDSVVAPSLTYRLRRHGLSRFDPDDAPDAATARLTEPERNILRLVAEGLSDREIAGRMSVNERTARDRVASVLGKLRLRDRVQAVLLAYDSCRALPGAGGNPAGPTG